MRSPSFALLARGCGCHVGDLYNREKGNTVTDCKCADIGFGIAVALMAFNDVTVEADHDLDIGEEVTLLSEVVVVVSLQME